MGENMAFVIVVYQMRWERIRYSYILIIIMNAGADYLLLVIMAVLSSSFAFVTISIASPLTPPLLLLRRYGRRPEQNKNYPFQLTPTKSIDLEQQQKPIHFNESHHAI